MAVHVKTGTNIHIKNRLNNLIVGRLPNNDWVVKYKITPTLKGRRETVFTKLEEFAFERHRNRFGAIGNVQFQQNILEMEFHRVLADG